MFENVFKLLKIKNKNVVHFFDKGRGGGRGSTTLIIGLNQPNNLYDFVTYGSLFLPRPFNYVLLRLTTDNSLF